MDERKVVLKILQETKTKSMKETNINSHTEEMSNSRLDRLVYNRYRDEVWMVDNEGK